MVFSHLNVCTVHVQSVVCNSFLPFVPQTNHTIRITRYEYGILRVPESKRRQRAPQKQTRSLGTQALARQKLDLLPSNLSTLGVANPVDAVELVYFFRPNQFGNV